MCSKFRRKAWVRLVSGKYTPTSLPSPILKCDLKLAPTHWLLARASNISNANYATARKQFPRTHVDATVRFKMSSMPKPKRNGRGPRMTKTVISGDGHVVFHTGASATNSCPSAQTETTAKHTSATCPSTDAAYPYRSPPLDMRCAPNSGLLLCRRQGRDDCAVQTAIARQCRSGDESGWEWHNGRDDDQFETGPSWQRY